MYEENLTHKCSFSFKCSQEWERFLPTEDSDRRFCYSCQRDVYCIDSEVDLTISSIKYRIGDRFISKFYNRAIAESICRFTSFAYAISPQ